MGKEESGQMFRISKEVPGTVVEGNSGRDANPAVLYGGGASIWVMAMMVVFERIDVNSSSDWYVEFFTDSRLILDAFLAP